MSEQIPNPTQAEKAADNEPNPSELTKTVFVRRSSGEVTKMRIADNASADESGRIRAYIVETIEGTEEEIIAGHKPVPESMLTDEQQILLHAEYAGVTLPSVPEKAEVVSGLSDAQEEMADEAIEDALGIQDPSEINPDASKYSSAQMRQMRSERELREAAERVVGAPAIEVASIPEPAPEVQQTPEQVLAKLTEGLSDSDRLELRSYAEVTDEVREAQREGRGEDSTYWQQIKGQSYRAMSARAQSVSNQFAGYYNLTR